MHFHRRLLPIILLVTSSLLNACTQQSVTLAYISNQGDNTISVIDTKQQKVIDTIPVDKAPVGIAGSATLQRVFVTNVDSQNI